MNEERPVIECRNVTHYYGKKLVYENLNIVVPEGHIMVLLGKNGAGKSTLFRCMLGLLTGYQGEIRVEHENIKDLTQQQMAQKMAEA